MGESVGRFVVLAGNIGVGKTSLAEALASRLGWVLGRESVDDNAYLSDYYLDPSRWAFPLAMHNLEQRLKQHMRMKRSGGNVILDRSIYEDRYVFVEMQKENGLLSERDYQCYVAFWNLLDEKIPLPDVLIYLRAPIDVIVSRISRRNRGIEKGISPQYLNALQGKYDIWIEGFKDCPILSIELGEGQDISVEAVLDSLRTDLSLRLAAKAE